MNTKSKKSYFQQTCISFEKSSSFVTNPLSSECSKSKGLSFMISEIIKEEFPHLTDTSLLEDLSLILLSQKLGTVQLLKNDLSYQEIINRKF